MQNHKATIRSFLIVLGAILLSGVFMAIGGLLFANSPEMALMRRIASNPFTENDATELWKAMDRISFIYDWIASPLIAALIGLFVGFLAKQYPIRLAVLGIAPFVVAFSSFSVTEIVFSVGYVLIAGGVSALVFRVQMKQNKLLDKDNKISCTSSEI